MNIRASILVAAAAILGGGVGQAAGEDAILFASREDSILRLVDRNGDGDFLDCAEATVYAEDVGTAVSAIAAGAAGAGGDLFAIDSGEAVVRCVRDLNGDGDAMDFGEVVVHGPLPQEPPNAVYAGLGRLSDGSLLAVETTSGRVYRLVDCNGDGDALDAGEVAIVAEGLTSPTALAVRPDDKVLIAADSAETPIRILQDLNGDGDYADFAENISYAEAFEPGDGITAPLNDLAYLVRPSDGAVLRLHDLTGDDDVLDFGEVVVFAMGLVQPSSVSHAGVGSLYVAGGTGGTIHHVRDLNADGDALDFSEVVCVAEGLGTLTGLCFQDNGCLAGDANEDGTVNAADVPIFVGVLLGSEPLPPLCLVDMNGDGQLDGGDIPFFTAALLR